MSNNTLTVDFDEKKTDALFAELDQCRFPGAAVGIAINGKPVYRKGFGLASMELPVVLSPSIRMRIYSTTKHFTCFAYMLLCEEGKAGIDDPVGKHLPEIHPVAHRVTMRQLMGNTGGLRDACDIRWRFSGTERLVQTAELLATYGSISDVNFAPGTGWCYNNGGFLLLSAAIERITGQSLEDVMRERIFQPVGMHDTLLRRFDTDFVPNSATMHMAKPTGGFDKSYLGGALVGEGGIVSTVDDMLRWLAHMDVPSVGNATTWATLKKPQTLPNGVSTGYGLGLMSDRYRGVEVIHHAGGGMGSNSQMLKVPAAGLDIAIMVNRHDIAALALANKILDVCLPSLEPVRESLKAPLATGMFRSPATGRVVQLFAKEGQQIASLDGLDMPVEPDESGTLRPAGQFRYLKHALTLSGESGRPVAVRLSDFGNIDDLLPVQVGAEPAAAAIVGHYRSDTAGVEAVIFGADRGLRLKTLGKFGSMEFNLIWLAESIWRLESISPELISPLPWTGILSFKGDTAFHFSSCITRELPFRRCA